MSIPKRTHLIDFRKLNQRYSNFQFEQSYSKIQVHLLKSTPSLGGMSLRTGFHTTFPELGKPFCNEASEMKQKFI